MAFDGIGDADSANQKRGEADQSEKLGEAVDGAFKLGRGVVAAANLPACLRQCASRIGGERSRGAIAGRVGRQPDPVDPAHQAARLQQFGRAQPGFADQEPGAQTYAAAEFVRLAVDDASDLERGAADGDAFAALEIEPRQQG